MTTYITTKKEIRTVRSLYRILFCRVRISMTSLYHILHISQEEKHINRKKFNCPLISELETPQTFFSEYMQA